MRTMNREKASALIVAVGLLAVLSAMAFTFVTIMRLEIEASVVSKMSAQTNLLDQWALQSVVDRLARDPYEGAMYTPIDWAGEKWYTRPLIAALAGGEDPTRYSPAMPLGGCLSFCQMLPGRGTFTVDARIIDCASQINLVDGDPKDEGTAWVDRKVRLLTGLPFAIDFQRDEESAEKLKPIPQYRNTYRLTLTQADLLVRKIQQSYQDDIPITTEEQVFQIILKYKDQFGSFDTDSGQPRRKMTIDTLSDFFSGKRDAAGNTVIIGFKDFITINSWIDERVMDATGWKRARRAPVNINTASSWVIRNVLRGLHSSEGASITDEDARALADYIVAYRTPAVYLTTTLRAKQDQLIDAINHSLSTNVDISAADPRNLSELQGHVCRMAQLLANPEFPKALGNEFPDDCDRGVRKFELVKQLDTLHNWIDRPPYHLTAGCDNPIGAQPDRFRELHRLRLLREDSLGDNERRPRLYTQLPRPFMTWEQFDAFLKVYVYGIMNGKIRDSAAGSFAPSVDVGRLKARLIMANCNPNSNYSRTPLQNCIATWNCGKDKISSNTETTEFCFSSFGKFETEMQVSSYSQVLSREYATDKSEKEGESITKDNLAIVNDVRNRNVTDDCALPYMIFTSDDIPADPAGRCFFFDSERRLSLDKAAKETPGNVRLRTVRGTPYTPDRLSFYNQHGELVGAWSIYEYVTNRDKRIGTNKRWGMLVLDRPISPVFSGYGTNSADPFYLDEDSRICLLRRMPFPGPEPQKPPVMVWPKTAVKMWAIERPQSVKKWSAVCSFAEVIRIDTQENFVQGRPAWNEKGDQSLTFMPNQAFQTQPSPGVLSRDGSVMLKTRSLDENLSIFNIPADETPYFTLPFDYSETVKPGGGSAGEGSGDTGDVYQGDIYPIGYKIGPPRPGDAGLSFPIYTLFPEEKTGDPDPIEFTIGMWICLNEKPDRNTTAQILVYATNNPDAKVQTTINLDIKQGSIELFLMAEKDKMPIKLHAQGTDAISIAEWLPGEWHYIGFAFSEDYRRQGQAQVQMFATKLVDNHDHYKQVLEVKQSPATDPVSQPLRLYEDAGGGDPVKFGGEAINAVVDDIVVLRGYILPEQDEDHGILLRRFYPDADSSKHNRASMAAISLDDYLDGTEAQSVEYGTVSWTEHMPARKLPRGTVREDKMKKTEPGQWSDASITVNGVVAGRDRWVRPSKADEKTDSDKKKVDKERRNPAWQCSVWFANDYLMAGFGCLARFGLNGEGQRISPHTVRDAEGRPTDWVCYNPAQTEPSYTGYMKMSDWDPPIKTFVNSMADTKSEAHVTVSLIGPRGDMDDGDEPDPEFETNPEYVNYESPWVDDITVTFFPPLNVYYWRQASDAGE
ncbi:MAG TPA: hypothetical protein VM223_01930 [Planctomycetota bacterium]|nr:hypothetical protein [Planctomycetota bacterium]